MILLKNILTNFIIKHFNLIFYLNLFKDSKNLVIVFIFKDLSIIFFLTDSFS